MTAEPVLIIGAGPTGLTAAILLARHGVRSLVVERHRDVYPLPRAVHLDDEVLRILQKAGVAERFTAVSRPALGMRLLDGRHRVIAEYRRDELVGVHGWPQANLFDQPDLERLLRAALGEYPEIRLRAGVEAEHIDPGDAVRPAEVRLRDVATGVADTVKARAVLGCDGANSLVREAIGTRMRDLRFTERWLVVDGRCARRLDTWDGVDQICDPRRAATFMRIGPDRYRWEFRMRPGETAEDLTVPGSLARLLAPWTRGVSFSEIEVIRSASYTFRARVADRWRSGRLFLLGDAAHLTPPFIGQGLCAGLRDAANLSWKLAAADADPIRGDGLLETYERERKPHVTRIIRMAVSTGWAMTGGQGPAASLRRAALARVLRMSAVTPLMLRGVSPRLRPGPLVARSRWAGTLMPQPSVTVDGARRRLDDLIGPGFAIVTTRPETPVTARLAAVLHATVVRVGPDGIEIHPPDGVPGIGRESVLGGWLQRMGTSAVVVRPDRTVLTLLPPASPSTGCSTPGWLTLLASASS
ncbi:3-(3-hydroxy-phenyl)propionate hydroxylase [Actinomadura madurae]|uniref:3-(3-hydroxy-phenyl)propionate hydroxylase n=1 Tax=Actinomadura madurae TaxID=1993 RepID=A0A1I5GKK5_9ACTN|nr:bifunctional 3-(3-hydroxy-phenyl)propionate/3-hydroxycinnamic acid hydroxylase [Actinomadura madurae]SFO36507.1 3-(3-hydroxy-phenyl)propionate hydroxylase [Actinomadura madurae]